MILHLTNSAISGAAAMLADAQRAAGHDAACLQFGALKPEMMLFSPAAIPVNLSRPAGREILTTMLARATVVHVHNWLPRQIENLVLMKGIFQRTAMTLHIAQTVLCLILQSMFG